LDAVNITEIIVISHGLVFIGRMYENDYLASVVFFVRGLRGVFGSAGASCTAGTAAATGAVSDFTVGSTGLDTGTTSNSLARPKNDFKKRNILYSYKKSR
jgi:hypothetical protein